MSSDQHPQKSAIERKRFLLSGERCTPGGFDDYMKTRVGGLSYEAAIPHTGITTLRNYIFDGTPPGDFLRAVLSNDLMDAMSRADEHNRSALFHYCAILYNYMPGILHGSPEKVRNWINLCQAAREEQEELDKMNDTA